MYKTHPTCYLCHIKKNKMTKLKIGVFGAGHLGKIHIKCLQQAHERYDLVGFYDANASHAEKIATELGIRAFDSVDALIAVVEVADIVTPTIHHFSVAKAAKWQLQTSIRSFCQHVKYAQ